MNKLLIVAHHPFSTHQIYDKTECVKDFKPEYILCDFLGELTHDDIMNSNFVVNPLYTAFVESGAEVIGCTNNNLVRKVKQSKKENNTIKELLTQDKIISHISGKIREYLEKGDTLAIINIRYYEGVACYLKKVYECSLKTITNNPRIVEESDFLKGESRSLNALLKQYSEEYPVIGQNF